MANSEKACCHLEVILYYINTFDKYRIILVEVPHIIVLKIVAAAFITFLQNCSSKELNYLFKFDCSGKAAAFVGFV